MKSISIFPFILILTSCHILMNPAFDELAEDAAEVVVKHESKKVESEVKNAIK